MRNGDYLAFISDGGYSRPELWMSEGGHSASSWAGKPRAIGAVSTPKPRGPGSSASPAANPSTCGNRCDI